MVLIDTDMVVTRPLGELIERAARGQGAWRSRTTSTASCPEWGELLDLGALGAAPYLCSGFVALGPRARAAS